MTTLEIEVAVMKHFGVRANVIVPNVSWGADLHECDLLKITKSGYATEIEIKISKQDLMKDKHKKHSHINGKIKELYFAAPIELKEIALQEIPENAGLLTVAYFSDEKVKYYEKIGLRDKYYDVDIVKNPSPKKDAYKWTDKEVTNIMRLGTMRILGLKQKIIKLQGENEK